MLFLSFRRIIYLEFYKPTLIVHINTLAYVIYCGKSVFYVNSLFESNLCICFAKPKIFIKPLHIHNTVIFFFNNQSICDLVYINSNQPKKKNGHISFCPSNNTNIISNFISSIYLCVEHTSHQKDILCDIFVCFFLYICFDFCYPLSDNRVNLGKLIFIDERLKEITRRTKKKDIRIWYINDVFFCICFFFSFCFFFMINYP